MAAAPPAGSDELEWWRMAQRLRELESALLRGAAAALASGVQVVKLSFHSHTSQAPAGAADGATTPLRSRRAIARAPCRLTAAPQRLGKDKPRATRRQAPSATARERRARWPTAAHPRRCRPQAAPVVRRQLGDPADEGSDDSESRGRSTAGGGAASSASSAVCNAAARSLVLAVVGNLSRQPLHRLPLLVAPSPEISQAEQRRGARDVRSSICRRRRRSCSSARRRKSDWSCAILTIAERGEVQRLLEVLNAQRATRRAHRADAAPCVGSLDRMPSPAASRPCGPRCKRPAPPVSPPPPARGP